MGIRLQETTLTANAATKASPTFIWYSHGRAPEEVPHSPAMESLAKSYWESRPSVQEVGPGPVAFQYEQGF